MWGSSEAGGKKDGGVRGVFFNFFYLLFILFLYHILVVKVQEITWSASYGENKTQKPKRTNKGNIWHILFSIGVRTGLRLTYGREIKTSKLKETLPQPTDSVNQKPT